MANHLGYCSLKFLLLSLKQAGGIIPEFVLPPVEVPEGGAGSVLELDVTGFIAESVDIMEFLTELVNVTGVVMMNKMGYEQKQRNHTTFAATQLRQPRNCLCLISHVVMCYILGSLRGVFPMGNITRIHHALFWLYEQGC